MLQACTLKMKSKQEILTDTNNKLLVQKGYVTFTIIIVYYIYCTLFSFWLSIKWKRHRRGPLSLFLIFRFFYLKLNTTYLMSESDSHGISANALTSDEQANFEYHISSQDAHCQIHLIYSFYNQDKISKKPWSKSRCLTDFWNAHNVTICTCWDRGSHGPAWLVLSTGANSFQRFLQVRVQVTPPVRMQHVPIQLLQLRGTCRQCTVETGQDDLICLYQGSIPGMTSHVKLTQVWQPDILKIEPTALRDVKVAQWFWLDVVLDQAPPTWGPHLQHETLQAGKACEQPWQKVLIKTLKHEVFFQHEWMQWLQTRQTGNRSLWPVKR